MSKIVFNPPGRTEPGYLRRMRRALELKQFMESQDIKPEHIDAIVEFMLPYVTEPENRDLARELLWDGSHDDFDRMLKAITGETGEANPTKPNEGTSIDT